MKIQESRNELARLIRLTRKMIRQSDDQNTRIDGRLMLYHLICPQK